MLLYPLRLLLAVALVAQNVSCQSSTATTMTTTINPSAASASSASASAASSRAAYTSSRLSYDSYIASSKLSASLSRSSARSAFTSSQSAHEASLSAARYSLSQSRSLLSAYRSATSWSRALARASYTTSVLSAQSSRSSLDGYLSASRASADASLASSRSSANAAVSASRSFSLYSASSSRASVDASLASSRSSLSLSKSISLSSASYSQYSHDSSQASFITSERASRSSASIYVASSKAAASASQYSASVSVASSKAAAASSYSAASASLHGSAATTSVSITPTGVMPALSTLVADHNGWQYAGCAKDNDEPWRSLNFKANLNSSQVTVETCIAACDNSSMVIAGLENANECWCGNRIGRSQLYPQSSCTSACAGNSSEVCGAPATLSLYTKYFNISKLNDTDTQAQSLARWTYYGCVSDTNTPRALGGLQVDRSVNSPWSCVSYCYDAGYELAGTEYSYQCFCGHGINNSTLGPDSNCNYGCYNNSAQACGGNGQLSLYAYNNFSVAAHNQTLTGTLYNKREMGFLDWLTA